MKPWQSLTISILVHAAILSIPVVVAINMAYPPGPVRFIVIGGGAPADKTAEATARSRPARDVVGKKLSSRPQPTPPVQPKVSPALPEKPAVPAKSRPEVHSDKKPHRHLRKAAERPRASRRHETRKRPIFPAPTLASAPPPAKAVPAAASSAKPVHLGSTGGAVAGDTAHTPAATASASGGPIAAELGAANGPRFIHRVMPDYPRLARRLGKQGTVLLRVTIDQRGRPIQVQVVKGAGYGFDDQARRAVQNSLFAPAREAGRAVCCKVLLPVRFVLRSSS